MKLKTWFFIDLKAFYEHLYNVFKSILPSKIFFTINPAFVLHVPSKD